MSEVKSLSVAFLNGKDFPFTHFSISDGVGSLNILESSDFVSVCDHFLQVGADSLSVYTDWSLSNLRTVGCRTGAAVFFEDIDLGLSIGVSSLMLSTLVELQTIALALKCVPLLSSVKLFSDSQSALDACKSELSLACLDFYNQYWVECRHIVNVIYIKDHSGISGNKCTNVIAGNASLSDWYLSYYLSKCFIVADSSMVSGNSRYFKIGSGSEFLAGGLLSEIDWFYSFLVWHLDLHMATDFTSRPSANKHLYNRLYPSVLCLYCGDVKASDYEFSYKIDDSAIFGFSYSFLGILQILSSCVSDSSLAMAFHKGFVFNDWFYKMVTIFHDSKIAGLKIVKFMYFLSLDFRSNVWLVHVKHCAYIEKNGLIFLDSLVFILVSGLASGLSAGVIKLLGIANAFSVCFGFCKSFFFVIFFNTSLFVAIEPASSSAGGSGFSLTGLEIQSGVKSKKCVESAHSCGASYKKPRKPEAAGRMMDSSAGPFFIGILGADGVECKKSWSSDIESDSNSVSKISDMENLKNTVAEETSYMDSNASDTDDMANNTTLRMTRTVIYVLGQLPKPPAFDKISNDKDVLALPSPKFSGSKCLPAVESGVIEKRNFESVKSFILDIEISAVSRKTNVDKLMAAREMAISENILVNNDLRKVNSRSDWEVIVKEILVDLPKSAIETVFSKFDKIISIKVQLIGLWQKALVKYELSEIADLVAARWSVLMGKDSVRMAKASIDKQIKQAPIAHPVSFGGKTWAQVASGLLFHVVSLDSSGVGANFGAESALVKFFSSDIFVSAIAKKLSCVEVVSSVSFSLAFHSIASASQASCVDLDMALDVSLATSPSLCPTIDDANPDFGSSSSKVLTAKVGGLESKLMALDASVGSVLAKLDMLCSGLGSLVLSSSQ
ncbi:hypothetical protein G9A89_023251 [Geosiphon pyriformis]|nr:hypothetical protein G9A89_023251 [Geosiphon pyriformis]